MKLVVRLRTSAFSKQPSEVLLPPPPPPPSPAPATPRLSATILFLRLHRSLSVYPGACRQMYIV